MLIAVCDDNIDELANSKARAAYMKYLLSPDVRRKLL